MMAKNLSSQPTKFFFFGQLLTTKMFNINIKREPKCMSFFTTFKNQNKKCFKVLNLLKSSISWCGHKVQASNYTHVWEEEQKKDGPTYGLMDGAC